MISQLRGTLVNKDASYALIDVNGVGYEVAISLNTYSNLPEMQQDVHIYTHFIVREDAQLLYGFHDKQERQLFKLLIKVNGIGPKVAVAILSQMKSHDLVSAIANQDSDSFKRIPGIGPKTAQRLLIELSDKINRLAITPSTTNNVFDKNQEVQQALMNLGYKLNQVMPLIKLFSTEETSVEEILTKVLQSIGKSK